MGKADITTKNVLAKNENFAELFNLTVFRGDPIVKPEELTEMNTEELIIDYGKRYTGHRIRNVLKQALIKTDGKQMYVLLGTESLTYVDYAMPAKNTVHHLADLSKLLTDTAARMRKDPDKSKYTADEYLSGFPKDMKLMPVITLTVYWGERKWDGPLSLDEMTDPFFSSRYPKGMLHYEMPLIDVHTLSDEQIAALKTEMNLLFEMVRASEDKEEMRRLAEQEKYRKVSADVALAIETLAHIQLRQEEEGGTVNMWKAFRDMKEEGRQEGREEGRQEGREEGLKLGLAEGESKKEKEDIRNTYELISSINPEMGKDSIIRTIAEKFRKTAAEVEAIVL
ncbi:MAG: Rpn family recombination-promoting nuclease/putative transposase [Solobacterium sp.]|nr:Rpn family recombination-promoting nuclease/putative transposase [Solobacterium sp.]